MYDNKYDRSHAISLISRVIYRLYGLKIELALLLPELLLSGPLRLLLGVRDKRLQGRGVLALPLATIKIEGNP